jgi:hypothetical protein
VAGDAAVRDHRRLIVDDSRRERTSAARDETVRDHLRLIVDDSRRERTSAARRYSNS